MSGLSKPKDFDAPLAELDLPEEYVDFFWEVRDRVIYFLRHIPRGIPDFTDHGLQHSIRVLKYVGRIIKEYPVELNPEEKFIMALAAPLHDLGCLVRRDNHSKISVHIIERPEFRTLLEDLNPQTVRFLRYVILAHSRSYPLKKVPTDRNLPLMCTLFRLADACDITAARVNVILLDILTEFKELNKKAQSLWKSHLAIEDVEIKGTLIRPWIYNEEEAKLCLTSLEDELDIINEYLSQMNLATFELSPKMIDPGIPALYKPIKDS